MICPPNSSFINPITFLFFPLGKGLSNAKFEVSNLVSTSSAISLSCFYSFVPICRRRGQIENFGEKNLPEVIKLDCGDVLLWIIKHSQ